MKKMFVKTGDTVQVRSGKSKGVQGEVIAVSPAEDKVIVKGVNVVTIKDRVKHPLYNKIVDKSVKYKAHDENNECGVGDKVQIMECRPLSKDKNWRVVEIIEKAK